MASQRYYVNNKAQVNGDHEVHIRTCSYFPTDYKDLGNHENCYSAVREASKTHKRANGCYYCCRECHAS